jgi:positive regulator of sigma E activity
MQKDDNIELEQKFSLLFPFKWNLNVSMLIYLIQLFFLPFCAIVVEKISQEYNTAIIWT